MMNLSGRTLRRQAQKNGLASPYRILRVVSLLDALGLHDLGVKSVSRLAYLLGFEYPWSLSRTCRDLTGEPLADVLVTGREESTMKAIACLFRAR